MRRALGILLAFFLAWYSASCTKQTHQGVFEAGNPGLRTVQGTVSEEDGVCLADQVVATDANAAQTQAVIDEACAFALSLPVEKSYSLVFLRDGVLVAEMTFDGSAFFFLEDGEAPLDLGLITLEGGATEGVATPEFPPPADENPPIEVAIPDLIPDLFGTYVPGIVSGLTCPETLGLVFEESVFEVSPIDGTEDGLAITQIVPSLFSGLTEILMTGSFVSPGYFSASGILPGGLQAVACEGPIGLYSDQWQLNATCGLTLLSLNIPLGTCVYSDFVQSNP